MIILLGTGLTMKIKRKSVEQVVNDFKNLIGANIKKRFSKYIDKKSMMIATFLDPRFKMFAFDEDDVLKRNQVLDAVKEAALNEAWKMETEIIDSNEKSDSDGEVESSTDEVCSLLFIKILIPKICSSLDFIGAKYIFKN